MKIFSFTIFCLLFFNFLNAQDQTSLFLDSRDGQTYKIVKLGTQWWMAENLRYQVEDSWQFEVEDGDEQEQGRLYTWKSALEACPLGWHLPDESEWNKMEIFLGMNVDDLVWKSRHGDTLCIHHKYLQGWFGDSAKIGNRLKSPDDWEVKKDAGIEFSGFNAHPSGYRQHMVIVFLIHIIREKGMEENATFWLSDKVSRNYSRYRYISNDKDGIFHGDYFNKAGFSVRCVKD